LDTHELDVSLNIGTTTTKKEIHFTNCTICSEVTGIRFSLITLYGSIIFPPYNTQGKVKCTLVQALRLCTGRTAHRGSRGIALLFHDRGNRRGCGVSVTPRPLFTSGKTRYPLYRRLDGPQGRCG